MNTYDQRLVGQYHTDDLRAQAQRDALARCLAPSRLRTLVRRFAR